MYFIHKLLHDNKSSTDLSGNYHNINNMIIKIYPMIQYLLDRLELITHHAYARAKLLLQIMNCIFVFHGMHFII